MTVAVWDLGGVLARFLPERRLAALAAATGLPPERVDGAIWGSGLDAAASAGELDRDETWAAVLAALGHRATRTAVRRAWATAFEPDPVALALVDATSMRSEVGLLSNNGPVVDEILDNELALVAGRVTHRLLSWRLGATKPATVVFDRAAAALGRPPADLLLVDDEPGNVAAARAAGWQATLWTRGQRAGGDR